MSVVDVAWEDMSRFAFSSIGRNITDATLRAQGYAKLCSIIRPPNFIDYSADFNIGRFSIKVGNETGEKLRSVPLRDYLNGLFYETGANGKGVSRFRRDPRAVPMHDYFNELFQEAVGGEGVIEPSRQVLVSSQTCVLPLYRGRCNFNMELFNYQTSCAYPACLAVVCTAEGTSAQVITQRGAQKLFHNRNGQACDFFAERLRHVRAREGRALDGEMNTHEKERNILLLFQVPLKVQNPRYEPTAFSTMIYGGVSELYGAASTHMAGGPPPPPAPGAAPPLPPGGSPSFRELGTDHAQLGIGKPHSAFPEMPRQLEMDPDAAIRCTVQHYLTTDQATLSDADLADIRQQFDAVYANAVARGSLVTDQDSLKRKTAPKACDKRFWFFTV
jgi:hypothetical protein